MRFSWIPEAPAHPGVYAIRYGRRVSRDKFQNCTMNAHEAIQFETRAECDQWCKDHPAPVFVPMEHGFE